MYTTARLYPTTVYRHRGCCINFVVVYILVGMHILVVQQHILVIRYILYSTAPSSFEPPICKECPCSCTILVVVGILVSMYTHPVHYKQLHLSRPIGLTNLEEKSAHLGASATVHLL